MFFSSCNKHDNNIVEYPEMYTPAYCSENYVITEDNKVYNTKLDRFIDNGIIEFKNNKYYYRIIK